MDSFWVAFIAALAYVPLFLLWVFSMVDIFDRKDLSGWGKAGWLAAVMFLPLFGTLIYLAARSAPLRDLAADEVVADTRATYVRIAAAELDKLARLRERGAISRDEYARLRLRVVGIA
jgi:hypothetical protein